MKRSPLHLLNRLAGIAAWITSALLTGLLIEGVVLHWLRYRAAIIAEGFTIPRELELDVFLLSLNYSVFIIVGTLGAAAGLSYWLIRRFPRFFLRAERRE